MFTTRHCLLYCACQAALSLCLWPAVAAAQTAVTDLTLSTAGNLENRTVGLTPMSSHVPFDSCIGFTCGSAWTCWP